MEAQKAKQLLTRQIEVSKSLGGHDSSSPAFQKWKRDTGVVIERIFGKSGRHLRDFESIHFSLSVSYSGMPDNAWVDACQSGLEEARAVLQSMLEEIEDFGLETSVDAVQNPQPLLSAQSTKLIFVSHSSADKDLADALLDMLCTSLHMRLADFVCTSIDGAKLRGGDDTDDVLRREIREVPAFLSILTAKAISSTYVLFELGARWGSAKHHIPLLAKGAGAEILREPLKAINALKLSEETDVLQLVEDLGSVLGRTPQPPNSFLKKARKIVELSGGGMHSEAQQTKSPKGAPKVKNSDLGSSAKPETRSPNRIDAEAEKLLTELANLGEFFDDPLNDTEAFGMHRVRLERHLSKLKTAGFLKEIQSSFGGSIYNITQAAKQYLLDHGLV